MAKADIWMPIYLGDYLRDTMQLSTEEHGAYFLILMELWNKGGKIPLKSLEVVARRPRNWQSIWENLQVFFDTTNGWVSQKRLSTELDRWTAFREAKQAAGAKGGRPKKPTGKPTGLTNDNLQAKPSPSPSPSPSFSPSNDLDRSTETIGSKIESIYKLYPRKVGKQAALKAIKVALKKTKPEVLKERVRLYADAVSKWPIEKHQYIPHPSTWFNQGRWEDDPREWEIKRPKTGKELFLERMAREEANGKT